MHVHNFVSHIHNRGDLKYRGRSGSIVFQNCIRVMCLMLMSHIGHVLKNEQEKTREQKLVFFNPFERAATAWELGTGPAGVRHHTNLDKISFRENLSRKFPALHP